MSLRVVLHPDPSGVTANPFLQLLADSLKAAGVEPEAPSLSVLRRGRPGVWNLHWPEFYIQRTSTRSALVGLCRLQATLALARVRGWKVVLTVHNVWPHEVRHPRLNTLLWKLLGITVSATIHLNRSSVAALTESHSLLGRKRWAVIPHGNYVDVYGRRRGRWESAAQLDLGRHERTILFLGQVRRYKGVELLLRAFREYGDPGTTLVVAGECVDPALEQELANRAAEDARVSLRLRRLADPDVATFLSCADLVVLPFARVTNSGSAILALSYHRRILVPRLPVFEELAERVGSDWVLMYSGPLTAAALEDALGCAMPESAPHLSWFSWAGVGRQTARFYAEIAGSAALDPALTGRFRRPNVRPTPPA